jgi:D-methionine transport system ATP-binding protein
MAFIEIEHLEKTFQSKSGDTEALRDVSFSIEQGEIFGVIGLSGAGKSTLVRCINLLEKPSGGRVIIDGRELMKLSDSELRLARREIGMIFQHFNLLMQRTVLDNVCFPMEIAGIRKREAREKALNYLEQVGLSDKASAYPAQLSGGQKQRVAIARVLASKPRILLCDEATSALDPQTTQSILRLLRQINEKYRITMVVITHEMRVVEQICDRVAVLEYGRIVETGRTREVFDEPKTEAARRLIYTREYTDIESEGSGI